MPHFRAHQRAPPFPALQRVSPLMCHVSNLTNALLPHPPLLSLSPCLQCAMFLISPTHSSLLLPTSLLFLVCPLPFFHAPPLPPPSPSPPLRASSFLPCPVSKLTNSLLPLPPLQLVSPCL